MKMHYAIFSGMFAATAGALGKISGHEMLKVGLVIFDETNKQDNFDNINLDFRNSFFFK